MNCRKWMVAMFATAAICGWGAGALAQPWPAKPIALLVGSAPGSAPDVYARAVAEPLSRLLGQTVIVENRTGANANIAAEWVARAPADGYTLWVPAQSQIEINPSAYPDLRWKPADFTGIIKGVESPFVLVTHPGVPAKTLGELVAWVKANPGKVSYASFSPGTPPDILAKLVEAAKAAHLEPAARERLERMGFDVPAQTGAEFAASMRAGEERWARVVKTTGFRAAD